MTASLSEQYLNLQPEKSWHASLALKFERRVQGSSYKNALVSALHNGPLRVQRAFYPEGPLVPHIYLLHPPGGVVAGDELSISFDVAEDSHGLVTTPSAGRVYRTNEQGLTQTQCIKGTVANNATLEWLPQENIIFTGANGINKTQFYLQEDANLMAWDISCLGRVVGNEPFESGRFIQSLEIFKNDRPALIERMQVDGGSVMMESSWGLQGFTVFGTFVSTIHNEELLKNSKEKLQTIGSEYALAFTQKKEFLICRYLGHSAIEARQCFSRAWHLIRPYMIDRAACEPRIWHT